MRIVNFASLKDVLQLGKEPDVLTQAEIAGITDASVRRTLTAISDWQMPSPGGCEFVVTLGWYTNTSGEGPRRIIFSTLWTRVWLVTSGSDPSGRNAVCVVEITWTRLQDILAQENGEAAPVELLTHIVKKGAAEQRTSLEQSAKAHQATAEYEKNLALLLGEIGRDVSIAA